MHSESSVGPQNGARIAVIVHTLNEERNILACLEHLVGYADDVLVVDMYSDDDTVKLAEQAGARVLLHERIVEFDFARNWSAEQVDADWVFYVDADERVPAVLWKSLRETLPGVDPSVGGLCLPYRNFFEGRWMQCLYPGYKAPMLLRRGRFTWRAGMHEGCHVDGQVAMFQVDTPDLAIDHYSYPSFDSYIRKSYLTYVPAEVLKLERGNVRFDWQEAVASFGRDLAHYYDQRAASRDGGEGFSWSLLSACYRLFTHLALYERQKGDVPVPSNAAEIVRGMLAGVEQVTPSSTGTGDAPSTDAPHRAPSLVWSSPLLDPSGYADEARNFVLGLRRSGTRVKADPIAWSNRRADLTADDARELQRSIDEAEPSAEYVHVQHIFPTAFQFEKDPRAKATVGRTMFETDRIPEAWVERCNALDEIWVPSDFNLETFAAAGVQRSKLKKVPGSLDRKRFERYLQPLRLEGARGFNFLSVFDWTLRKGWDVLLRAYVEEFGPDDDVCLFVKTHSSLGHPDQEIVRQIESFVGDVLGKDLADAPQIRLLTGTWSDEQMLRLYRSVDAYVMPSRGEGWGRPLMDAMASGLPTIGTGWSGNTEFMTPANSYLIDYELADVAPSAVAEAAHFAGHRWAEPSVKHLRSTMREVVSDPASARARGAQARADVLEKFDRPAVAKIIDDQVNRLLEPATDDKLSVTWEGSQFVYHSLAHVNREVCLELVSQPDIDLSIVPYESHQFDASQDPRFLQLQSRFTPTAPAGAAVHVRHQWPPRFDAPRDGAWVMIQPWEFGGLPAEWIEPMREEVDEIWVPSEWVRQCYIRSGIPAEKVVVIANGVDTSLYRPDGRALPLKTRKSLKLLFVGGTIGRKGIDVLLNTYVSTFTAQDDVCLVIKSNGANGAYRGSAIDDEIRRIAALPNAPEIELIVDDLSDADVAALYRACDVLVHPYRGEGFGMPIAEAMASGLAVVVTNYGACLDFCDDRVGYLVPARVVNIPEASGLPPSSIGYWWAEPNPAALSSILREIVRDPSGARAKGVAGVRRMRDFSWQQVGARVRERVQVLAGRTPVRLLAKPQVRAEVEQTTEPLPLDGRRGTTLLLEPRWTDPAWEQVLVAFSRVYGPRDDVTLVVRLDPSQGVSPEQAAHRFEAALRAAGLDPDAAPDVLLVPDDLDPCGVQRLYAAVDHRLPLGPEGVEVLARLATGSERPRAA